MNNAPQAEKVARLVLEVVNTYKRAIGFPETPIPPIGETSERLQGVVQGVLREWVAPSQSAKENHDNWCAQMLNDGWGYGDVIDEEKKTHPALTQWDYVPLWYQCNDLIFLNIVHSNKPQTN